MADEWTETITGRPFGYDAPDLQTSHLFTEIAPVLARILRFGGHTFYPLSVAQHSLICAEAAEDLTGDLELAAACLLHDAHEVYTGDITTPMQNAIAIEMLSRRDPKSATSVRAEIALAFVQSLEGIKSRIDVAVAYAAGFDEQLWIRHRQAVKAIDLRALRTERDHRKMRSARRWIEAVEEAEPLPIRPHSLSVIGEHEAQARFVEALRRLCPAARGVTA